jgi:plastocyanin
MHMKNKIFHFFILSNLMAMLAFTGCTNSSNPVYGSSKLFDSGTMGPGGHFTYVFAKAIVVPYYCKFHGGAGGTGMSGKITVQAGGTPSSDTISMVGTSFIPAALTIDVGDTVLWINNSGLDHTVTSDN